ncbi:MAG: hypothetical protein EXQ50_04505 [Acidobacteria bacterium]|nr:hypothetical protein [Acidobacteriota bacterium]
MFKIISVALSIGAGMSLVAPPAQPALQVAARRLSQNPLITTRSSRSLGDNVNGPSVIRVPSWVARPLGRYYMYFGHHMGTHIRLAYADAIEGPWKIHDPGVLPVAETALFRPPPDPIENLENFYTHVASPEIEVDPARRRLVMWFHGWWTDGKMWPVGEPAARDWARQNGYSQFTQAATSSDGVRFEPAPAITRIPYLRVFRIDHALYGMGRLGRLARSSDPLASFELGPNPFGGGPYANRVRHVALVRRGALLYVFFTAIGDAPERILMSTLNVTGDWNTWTASPPVEVLAPEAPYECATLPVAPSAAGDLKGPARQLRDPAIFEENGRVFLFYSFCGEQGIAAAELTFP